MNIYLRELKTWRRNTLLWIASLCAGTLFLFWMYPTFAGNMEALGNMLDRFPEAVRQAMGISVSLIGTVNGFFAFIITFLMLCGAVQAMMLGLSAVGRETTGKTADFLLTRPVGRGKVLTAKLLAVLTCVALTSLALLGAATAMAYAFADGPFEYMPFFMISLSFFFEQVIFLAVGFAIGAVARRVRSPLPVALSTVLGVFVVGMVASSLELPDLYYLSPFKYFDTLQILTSHSYRPSFMLAAAAITGVSLLCAYAVFLRRDLSA